MPKKPLNLLGDGEKKYKKGASRKTAWNGVLLRGTGRSRRDAEVPAAMISREMPRSRALFHAEYSPAGGSAVLK